MTDNRCSFVTYVTRVCVEKSLCSLKINNSHDIDNICGHLLKSCAKGLSSIFQYIFNESLKIQHVAKIWKDAVVVFVPKISSPPNLQ